MKLSCSANFLSQYQVHVLVYVGGGDYSVRLLGMNGTLTTKTRRLSVSMSNVLSV